MNFVKSVHTCLQLYITLRGRASRSEYLYFSLFNLIALIFLVILSAWLGALLWGADRSSALLGFVLPTSVIFATAMATLFALLMALPNWTVSVRRLHDSDKSGWWLLLGFLPYVGGLIVMVLLLLPSTDGPNQYGAAEAPEC